MKFTEIQASAMSTWIIYLIVVNLPNLLVPEEGGLIKSGFEKIMTHVERGNKRKRTACVKFAFIWRRIKFLTVKPVSFSVIVIETRKDGIYIFFVLADVRSAYLVPQVLGCPKGIFLLQTRLLQ